MPPEKGPRQRPQIAALSGSHNKAPGFAGGYLRAPGTGALLEVKVLPRADHSERSEVQLREGDRAWGGSMERSCGPMNKNRIQGGADQGELA